MYMNSEIINTNYIPIVYLTIIWYVFFSVRCFEKKNRIYSIILSIGIVYSYTYINK